MFQEVRCPKNSPTIDNVSAAVSHFSCHFPSVLVAGGQKPARLMGVLHTGWPTSRDSDILLTRQHACNCHALIQTALAANLPGALPTQHARMHTRMHHVLQVSVLQPQTSSGLPPALWCPLLTNNQVTWHSCVGKLN
jgi:hypothetical protein